MRKKVLSLFLILSLTSVTSLTSCGDGGLDIDIGFDLKGTWQLYETCLSGGCVATDPNIEVTIEFREDDLIEKQDGLVIGSGDYIVGELHNQGDETIYLLVVDGVGWEVTVTETTLDILVNLTFRRYNKVS